MTDTKLQLVPKRPHLNEGEILVGLIGAPDGNAYYLILLPGDNAPAPWQAQMDWAKSIGGDLPDRVEQAMLDKHFRGEFQRTWYWSNTTDEDDSSWAWCQDFGSGGQDNDRQDDVLRARAVRRLPI